MLNVCEGVRAWHAECKALQKAAPCTENSSLVSRCNSACACRHSMLIYYSSTFVFATGFAPQP